MIEHVTIGDNHAILYHADCLDILPAMQGGSVQAVITDPPYGNNTAYSSYSDTRDNLTQLVNAFMPHVLRIADRALITCGVPNIQLYPQVDWILSWTTAAGAGSGKWGFCCWQPILAYGKDPFLQDGKGRRPDTYMFGKPSDKLDHPCPKPVELMKWIIERGTRPGETVLDPFMGAGSTGIACMQTGRKFIGIELDQGYFDLARDRIAQAQLQMRLPI